MFLQQIIPKVLTMKSSILMRWLKKYIKIINLTGYFVKLFFITCYLTIFSENSMWYVY